MRGYIGPVGASRLRRLWNRLWRRGDPWKGWEDIGYISEGGIALGEYDYWPEIKPDFDSSKVRYLADLNPGKVTFSAELTLAGVDPYLYQTLYGLPLHLDHAERQAEVIAQAWRKASEAGHGVLVVGQPFQVYASPYVAEGTLLYAPRLIDGVAHPKEGQ